MDDSYRDEFAVAEALQEYIDKQRCLAVLKNFRFSDCVTAPPPVAKTRAERAVRSFKHISFTCSKNQIHPLFQKIQGIVAPVFTLNFMITINEFTPPTTLLNVDQLLFFPAPIGPTK